MKIWVELSIICIQYKVLLLCWVFVVVIRNNAIVTMVNVLVCNTIPYRNNGYIRISFIHSQQIYYCCFYLSPKIKEVILKKKFIQNKMFFQSKQVFLFIIKPWTKPILKFFFHFLFFLLMRKYFWPKHIEIEICEPFWQFSENQKKN